MTEIDAKAMAIVVEDGKARLLTPKGFEDREMSDAELLLGCIFVRMGADQVWCEDVIKWFHEQ